jgi:hypothetical protein
MPKVLANEVTPLLDSSSGITGSLSMSSKLDVAALRAPMQAIHDSGVNGSLAWRVKQLTTMKRMIREHRNEILEALKKDLGKHPAEASCSEL